MTTLKPLTPSPWLWLRRNLFNTWYNVILTLIAVVILGWILVLTTTWAIQQAQWRVIQANLSLFLVGRYPKDQVWRVAIAALWFGAIVIASSWYLWQQPRSVTVRRPASWVAFITHPLSITVLLTVSTLGIWWLLSGGAGLKPVPPIRWNGLLLTVVLSVVSIGVAFPLGVLLALGRQSDLPVIRWFSVLYIEIVRGLPLIGILFMAMVMLQLLFPPTIRLDRVLRAIAGLALFNAAYLAEAVRGGLQAIPRGQYEAAKALGLGPWLTMGLIVLPQALRAVIPAIVNQFISLFKDTSLLALFALVELTGISRSILAQADFIGRYAEVYLFIGAIYWLICYGMSQFSQRLEQTLGSR
ncbi:MAG: amino acid ABC transporter permease [Cyanobacteria bacterium]|nr:amino acid ABC transporter permease [Cyanobacteriota bacterium]MDW8201464.1 amino acid ABC transporter permease [Cyanobacteriota bacterium SKYGB_h_bin112]